MKKRRIALTLGFALSCLLARALGAGVDPSELPAAIPQGWRRLPASRAEARALAPIFEQLAQLRKEYAELSAEALDLRRKTGTASATETLADYDPVQKVWLVAPGAPAPAQSAVAPISSR